MGKTRVMKFPCSVGDIVAARDVRYFHHLSWPSVYYCQLALDVGGGLSLPFYIWKAPLNVFAPVRCLKPLVAHLQETDKAQLWLYDGVIGDMW